MKRSPRTSTSREAIVVAQLCRYARKLRREVAQRYMKQEKAASRGRGECSGSLRGCCAQLEVEVGELCCHWAGPSGRTPSLAGTPGLEITTLRIIITYTAFSLLYAIKVALHDCSNFRLFNTLFSRIPSMRETRLELTPPI